VSGTDGKKHGKLASLTDNHCDNAERARVGDKQVSRMPFA